MQKESTLTRLTMSRRQKVTNAVSYLSKKRSPTFNNIKVDIITQLPVIIQKFQRYILGIIVIGIGVVGFLYWLSIHHIVVMVAPLIFIGVMLAIKFPKVFLRILFLILLFLGAMLLRHRQGNNSDTSYNMGYFLLGDRGAGEKDSK